MREVVKLVLELLIIPLYNTPLYLERLMVLVPSETVCGKLVKSVA